MVQRRAAAVGVCDAETLALQHRLDQPSLRRIVVDDQDRFIHSNTPNQIRRAFEGETFCSVPS